MDMKITLLNRMRGKKDMFKILKYMKAYEWVQAAFCVAFIVAQIFLDLRLPEYMHRITQLATTGGNVSEIWVQGAFMLVYALGSVVCAFFIIFFAARIGASFSRRLRRLMFNKVESFALEEINKFSTASLITRSTNDVTQVQMVIIMVFQIAIRAPIAAIWAFTKISGSSIEWTAAVAVAIGIMVIMTVVIISMVMPKFKLMQELTDDITRVTRENLTGLRVVRAYNAEGYQEEKFDKANDAITGTQLFTSRAMASVMPMMNIIFTCLPLVIYWTGAHIINDASYVINEAGYSERHMIFGDLVVFTTYAMHIVMSFMMLAMMFVFLPRGSVSAKRINEVLDTKPSIVDGSATAGLDGMTGEVEFRNVSFKYAGSADYVLQDISFTAKQGETVAFIGSTGSGKTSLVNLVPRFYDATEGEVLVNGVNVKEYKLEALYNLLGCVPQKAVLLKGTVGSNVALGDNGRAISDEDLKEEAVKKAVSVAQGAEFVENMDGQYNAEISQGGANISGGQKQRLSIARAVYRQPEIYIFDDSFSALDYKTDRQLRSALKQETAGVTSLIVAQRIGTIMDADQIIVLDEGRVVGKGTHKELLKTCAVYKEIAESSMSEEELAI